MKLGAQVAGNVPPLYDYANTLSKVAALDSLSRFINF